MKGARAKFDLRNRFNSFAPCISDCFYENLGLRLNPKTQLFNLEDKDDKKRLERNLKKVSQETEMPDEENNESATTKIKKIFNQLRELKNSTIAPHFEKPRESNLDEEMFAEVLKEVNDKKVQNMLDKPINKFHLQKIFMSYEFSLELVNAYPLIIIMLILKCDEVPKKFEEFLLSKKHLTSGDIYLILTYLCQTKFAQKKLLKLLKRNPQMKEIIKIFKTDSLPPKLMGYYGLKAEPVSKIAEPDVVEQIRLRVLCELNREYSVALNHLLNEIQAICRVLDEKAKITDRYAAPAVIEFLRCQKVPHETHAQIRNLFDRRNKNPVSHADPIAWAVTKDEYMNYSKHVGDCLKNLFEKEKPYSKVNVYVKSLEQ